jgi:telomerase reverse transcriptase
MRVRLHAPLSDSPLVPESSDLKTQTKAPSLTLRPTSEIPPETQSSERFTDYASSAGEVAGFVKATIKRVIPYALFGSDDNKKLVLRMVDRFIKLRRYESFSLHEVLQGLKVRLSSSTKVSG